MIRTRITRKKSDATLFTFRPVIGIAIGTGSLAGDMLLFCVIWRLWRLSKYKEDKHKQQANKISAIPPSTSPNDQQKSHCISYRMIVMRNFDKSLIIDCFQVVKF